MRHWIFQLPAIALCPTGLLHAQIDFAHQVVPILKKHCVECHGGDESKGGFSMNTRGMVLEADVLEVGKPDESYFIELLVTDDEDERMPPVKKSKNPLPKADIEILSKWIEEGLKWEPGFTFATDRYKAPLKPRAVELPEGPQGANPIDLIVGKYFQEKGMDFPEPADDATFLARAFQDLIGLPPGKQWVVSSLEGKLDRAALVEQLLADKQGYAEHWMTFWNDLLRNGYDGTGFITGGRSQITHWLYGSLYHNKPYDQFVRELVAPSKEAQGFIEGIKWRGNVNASQTLEIQFAQNVAQVFLGINLKCASCHDSFIDRWKLDDAYRLAAVYSAEPVEINRCDKPTGKFAQPGWLFTELGDIDPKAPQPRRLQQLADLLTHRDNGRLTRTIVNRLWHRLMGRGIIHPVDAMQIEPWSADLLDHLAEDLAGNGYDLKRTLALIVSSRAYQSRALSLSSEPDARSYAFAGPLTKRMAAEQFLDAIWQITDAGPSTPDVPVFRGRTEEQDSNDIPINGRWVWSYPEGSQSVPKAGETITLRRRITFPERPRLAAGVITADNEYALYVNGHHIRSDNFWPTVEVVSLAGALRAGSNEFLIVAKNAGDRPNAAAAFFEARMKFADGTEQVVATDANWEWTKANPQVRRDKASFKNEPADWKPAAEVENQSFLPGKVRRAIGAKIGQIYSAKDHFVRASLVKLDFLARSLGRPFRDQVVSTRPENLTTLQAIDLQNGDVLNSIIVRAGKNVAAKEFAPDALVEWLYTYALSRPPTPREREVAISILANGKGNQGIEDLLWTVFMLPEFQLIR